MISMWKINHEKQKTRTCLGEWHCQVLLHLYPFVKRLKFGPWQRCRDKRSYHFKIQSERYWLATPIQWGTRNYVMVQIIAILEVNSFRFAFYETKYHDVMRGMKLTLRTIELLTNTTSRWSCTNRSRQHWTDLRIIWSMSFLLHSLPNRKRTVKYNTNCRLIEHEYRREEKSWRRCLATTVEGTLEHIQAYCMKSIPACSLSLSPRFSTVSPPSFQFMASRRVLTSRHSFCTLKCNQTRQHLRMVQISFISRAGLSSSGHEMLNLTQR